MQKIHKKQNPTAILFSSKSLISILLACCMILSSPASIMAAAPKTTTAINPLTQAQFNINGENILLNTHLLIKNSTHMKLYPLKDIADRSGIVVNWDKTSQSVKLKTPQGELSFNSKGLLTINDIDKKHNYNFVLYKGQLFVSQDFFEKELKIVWDFDATAKTYILKNSMHSLEDNVLNAQEQTIKKNLEKYLSFLELKKGFSGQILVANNNKVLIHKAYGLADKEAKISNTIETTFAMGSITKQFTATAVLQLVEQNKIKLDAPISKYLDKVPFGDKITVHQLLTHTSGLFDFTEAAIPKYLSEGSIHMSYNDFIAMIKDKPLNFEPGTQFKYSNTGYYLLGALVEKVSGEALPLYFDKHLIKPAQMTATSFAYDGLTKKVKATGYMITGDKDEVDKILLNIAGGAGALSTTVADLYHWNNALYTGKLLSANSLSQMTGQDKNMKLLAPYAYGLMIDHKLYGNSSFHGGNTLGFTAENAYFPDKNAQIIILTNKGYADLNSIKANIVSIFNGKMPELKENKTVELTPAQIDQFVGDYEIPGVLKIKIFRDKNKLLFQGENQPAITLEAASAKEFFTEQFGGISIHFDQTENPTGFLLKQAGISLQAQKIK